MVPSKYTNGGIMMKTGFTPQQRRCIYFNVCITSRMMSSVFIYFWGHFFYVRLFIFLYSLTLIYLPRSYINVWWDRVFLKNTGIIMCVSILLQFSSDALCAIILLNTLCGIELARETLPWDS